MPEAYYISQHWQIMALGYETIMEKARPQLEANAEQRARNKIIERRMLAGKR